MSANHKTTLDQLKLAMLDSRENLLDFFSRAGFESQCEGWLEVQIEAPARNTPECRLPANCSGVRQTEDRLRLA